MDAQVLSKYLHLFGSLHANRSKDKGAAPHKPILLLSLLDEIERGHITSNFVPITLELTAAFRSNWRALAPSGWRERLVYPFRYLVKDGFWELVKDGAPQTTKEVGDPVTINELREKIDGGRFAPDLWGMLQDRTTLNAFRAHVVQTYFGLTIADGQPRLAEDPVRYEVEKLKAEAQGKFRIRHVRETRDETGYFVRHALFPKVVKSLYNETCAVCELSVHTDKGSGIVDAAHIMPFGLFHNDDPRNGIALCKNHHWGFDAGWFTATDDYKLLVSPHLQNGLTYVTAGSPLRLPEEAVYAPDSAALAWHRDTKFLK